MVMEFKVRWLKRRGYIFKDKGGQLACFIDVR